jgi:hypothetical protein
MPCTHKFADYLNLDNLNFIPTTLIVGTFNPGWDNIDNNASWFYGRTHDNNGNRNNNFWDVLPRIYNQESLINGSPNDWKQFCSDERIAITDIIGNIEDANQNNPIHVNLMRGFADNEIVKNFYDFDLVNIVRILRNNPAIVNVYITRGITESFWKNKLYSLKNYCDANNIRLIALITPSSYARFQQGRYNNLNPNDQLNLADFILMRWQENWHPINENEH